jgi:putative GTP pyrophosphokinase
LDIGIVEPDYESRKREFFDFYSENEQLLIEARDAFEGLIKLLISALNIEGVKVTSRLKNKHECIRKFDIKYRQELEKSNTDYNIKNCIGDLIGVRVICLYESQTNEIVKSIKKEFDTVKEENKSLDLYDKVRFGYKGVHLDLSLIGERKNLIEYGRFSDFTFELQVRSIVQDAWSEVDHRLKYKKQIPDNLKRRIIRLAALFELADQEFEEIRRTTDEIENRIKTAIPNDINQEQHDDNTSKEEFLNSFNFLEFVTRRYPTYVFESFKIDGFVDDVISLNPNISIKKFIDIFNRNYEITHSYRNEMKKINEININPYTHMRHMLVLENPELYSDMLYPKQKEKFLSWVEELKSKT